MVTNFLAFERPGLLLVEHELHGLEDLFHRFMEIDWFMIEAGARVIENGRLQNFVGKQRKSNEFALCDVEVF